jgi:hypothetical protein
MQFGSTNFLLLFLQAAQSKNFCGDVAEKLLQCNNRHNLQHSCLRQVYNAVVELLLSRNVVRSFPGPSIYLLK